MRDQKFSWLRTVQLVKFIAFMAHYAFFSLLSMLKVTKGIIYFFQSIKLSIPDRYDWVKNCIEVAVQVPKY